MKNKIILKVLFCLLILIFFFPYQTTLIPEWRVQVVDTLDKPRANEKIRQVWSYATGSHEETLTTDSDGVVVFPARTTRLPLLFRILAGLSDRINYSVMPHGGSIGARALVFSATGARTNWLRYSEGMQLEHKLVFQQYP